MAICQIAANKKTKRFHGQQLWGESFKSFQKTEDGSSSMYDCCGISQIFMLCNSDGRMRGHSPLEGF